MKWAELRRALGGKLKSQCNKGAKHDTWHISNDNGPVGIVLDVHGDGEMKSREIGNVARSMHINEYTLKEIVRCNISRDQYLEKAN